MLTSCKCLKIRLFLLSETLAFFYFICYNNGVSGVIYGGVYHGILFEKNETQGAYLSFYR